MAGPSTFWAPVHRLLNRIAPGSAGFPLNAAPSIDFAGSGVQDHRLPYNQFNNTLGTGIGALGWYGGSDPMTANFVPAAAATANIAALANVVNGAPMTLVSVSGAGIVAITAANPAYLWPAFPLTNKAALTAGAAIDALPTYLKFGAAGSFTSAFYNRQTCVGRCVSITGVTGGTGGNFLVSGYDTYGYAMSQLVTVGAGINTVNTKKAFKVVTSVVPQFTDAHTYSVGTADIFGFGLLTSYWGDASIIYNNTTVTTSTGFLAADTTAPATTTTGDVRGTYAVQIATDGVKRLTVFVTPSLSSMLTNFTTGLFGQAQV